MEIKGRCFMKILNNIKPLLCKIKFRLKFGYYLPTINRGDVQTVCQDRTNVRTNSIKLMPYVWCLHFMAANIFK